MADKRDVLEACARALQAARPFVVDGRPNEQALAVVAEVDAALRLAHIAGVTSDGANDAPEWRPDGENRT